MKLSEFKSHLQTLRSVSFELPDGSLVPSHFHVTEVGKITKDFIDCGGTVRSEKVINFQLWTSIDYDHTLAPQRLMEIIQLSEETLNLPDLPIEVEYQHDTVGKYGLAFNGTHFVLTPTLTDCLAPDKCNIPQEKPKIKISDLQNQGSCCDPTSGCC